jgi:hypothetical protein
VPEFDKISQYVDEAALKAQTDFFLGLFDKIEDKAIEVAKSFKGLQIKVEGGSSLKDIVEGMKKLSTETASYNKVLKDGIDAQIKAEKLSQQLAKTKAEEAKASKEVANQKLAETKAETAANKEKEKSSKASAAAAEKARKEAEAYNILVKQFAAAAREAKNLAAQYGTQDKRAQAAAKTANELNNQLKAIDASIGNHQRNVGNYSSAVETATGKLKAFGLQFLGLIGIASVGSFLKDSVDEFLQLDKNLRILQNTLKNIGVPELFGRIEESTKRLKNQFKFLDDDEILSTFNKLVVYGKLTENQINDLLPVIVNFSVASGQSLEESTSTIIKALEGNGKALKEYGINIKDAKNVTEAYGIVMKELAPRVEGVADAFGKSAAGSIAESKQQFKDLKEEVGQGLLPVLITLLGLIDKLLTGFGYLKKSLGNFFSDVGDLFSGDFEVLIGKGEGKAKRLEELNRRIEKEAAKGILAEALNGKSAGEAIGDLNNRLAERIQFLERARKNASGIFNADDIKTSEKAIRVLRSSLEELFKTQSDNKDKVLGSGDPDKTKAGATKDQLADLARNREAIRKALLDAQKQLLQDQIDASKEIVADDRKTYEERFAAAQVFYDKSIELAQLNKKFALDDIDASQKEEKRKANLDITDKKALADTLKAISEKSAQQRLVVEAEYNSSVRKLTADDEKQLLELRKKQASDLAAHNKSVHEQEMQDIQNGYDEALNRLDKRYLVEQKKARGNKEKQAAAERNYNAEKLRLQVNLQESLLQEDIRFTKETLDLAEARAKASGKQEDIDAVIKVKQDLAALEIKLQKLITDYHIKSNEDQKKSDQQLANERLAHLEKLAGYAKQVFDLVAGFAAISVDKQLNAVQDQIDALDKQKEKDIEVANSSITNAQDRANEIARIEATSQVKKEALERRQRQLQIEKARFEKAATIASLILETSLAVLRALSDKTVTFPVRLADAIAVGVIGAANIAKAIATPIPKFRTGLNRDYEGFGIVGDGGKHEVIERKDGNLEVTSDSDTLAYINKGDRIHPDADAYMMKYYQSIALGSLGRKANAVKNSIGLTDSILLQMKDLAAENKALQLENKNILNKIAGKKELHLDATEGGLSAMWKYGANTVKYINEQTQW